MTDYKRKNLMVMFFCYCIWIFPFAQQVNLGRLPVKNYPKSVYQAGTQTWDIAQDKLGVMYFANNDGLLKFDGTYWENYPIDNGTIVRSVMLSSNGRIYIGGQGELGYFLPNNSGHLVYHSLSDKIPEDNQNVADIWGIEELGADVFFRSDKYLLQLNKDDRLSVVAIDEALSFIGQIDGKLYVQNQSGLFLFDGNALSNTPVVETDYNITSFLAVSDNKTLITTLKQGVFIFDGENIEPWITSEDDFLREKRIYTATLLADQQIALGTSMGGVMILNSEGQVLRQIDKAIGLQNSNVLSLFKDADDNLWCALDNGIDYVEVQSSFIQILPDFPLDGTGYSVATHNEHLYFATSHGIYVNDWKLRYQPNEQEAFRLVNGTSGQAWQLHVLQGDLLLGHHEGAFQLQGERAINISNESTWCFIPLNDNKAIRGHYSGISLLEKKDGKWKTGSNLKGIEESCRIMVTGKGKHIWMTHPYRGVYSFVPNPETKSVDVVLFTEKDGLPSELNNYVFDINGTALFGTESGVYAFDETSQKFIADTMFNKVLGNKSRVKYLRSDQYGNIWFVTNNEVGYLEVRDKGLSKSVVKKVIPELNNKMVGGFEMIYPYDEENVFFGSENGFILFNPKSYNQKRTEEISVLLNKVNVFALKDSTVAGAYYQRKVQEDQVISFSPKETAYRFYFSAPCYAGNDPVEYQYKLEGLDQDWSEWSDKTEKEYTNLGVGDYIFRVKARKDGRVLDRELTFPFVIDTPWYATILAKFIYVILLLSIFGGIIFGQRKKHEAVTAELKSEHFVREQQQQQLVDQREEQLVKLRNETLEKELQFRQKELATNAMHLMQKGELLASIKEALLKATQKDQTAQQTKSEINKVINMMEQDSLLDESWEQFIFHFDQVHAGFFTKLRQLFPNLTSYDQKMCAYLRMNLTTKEIASLLNISVRGVEGGRYRLRKKLSLAADVNLVSFIQEI